MATPVSDFDPYYKWLSIPPELQPPDHYRLLGLKLFEDDREVIATAADRQMAHVKTFAVGRYSRESQSLLAELAKAKLCLLNAQKKAAYDARLLAQTTSSEQVATMDATPAKTKAVPALAESTILQCAPANLTRETKPSLTIKVDKNLPATIYRTSKRPAKNLVVGWYLLTFTLAVAGFGILWMSRAPERQPPREIAARPRQPFNLSGPRKPVRPIPQVQPNKPEQRPVKQIRLPQQPFVPPIPQAPEQKVEKQPLVNLPINYELPTAEDISVATICNLPPTTTITIISPNHKLILNGNRLEWHEGKSPNLIGGLQIENEQLHFRWLPNAPEEAEITLRNALIHLSLDNQSHIVALRSPEKGRPFQYDLSKPYQRLLASCDHLPPLDQVRFELSSTNELPSTNLDASVNAGMEIGQTLEIQFTEASSVFTCLEMQQLGNVPRVKISTTYELPSGETRALTFKHLNKSANLIERDLFMIDGQIADLNQLLKKPPQGKRSAIKEEINLLQEKRKVIVADQTELDRVRKLADKLDGKSFGYHFFTYTQGHRVELLTAK